MRRIAILFVILAGSTMADSGDSGKSLGNNNNLATTAGEIAGQPQQPLFQYPLPELRLPEPVAPQATDDELISWLGASTYQRRRVAYLELLRRGPAVLKAVQQASQSSNPEVSNSANLLLRSIGDHPMQISFEHYLEGFKQHAVRKLHSQPALKTFLKTLRANLASNSAAASDLRETMFDLSENSNALAAVLQAEGLCSRERGILESRLVRAQKLSGSFGEREINTVQSLIESNSKLASKLSKAASDLRQRNSELGIHALDHLQAIAPELASSEFQLERFGSTFKFRVKGDEHTVSMPITEGVPMEAQRAPGFATVPVRFDTQTGMEAWRQLSVRFEPEIELSASDLNCELNYTVVTRHTDPNVQAQDLLILLRALGGNNPSG